MRIPCILYTMILAIALCTGCDQPSDDDDTTGQPDDDDVSDDDSGDDDLSDDDAADDDTGDDDTTEIPCGPEYHPFGAGNYCADCQSGGGGGSCYQSCIGCPDGSVYRAECDEASSGCVCFIDDVEVCTCTSTYSMQQLGCQPEEWGGANCCWNVG